MRTVVFDSTQLSRDLLLRGLPFQLIEHMESSWLDFCVPAPVVLEMAGNYERQRDQLIGKLRDLARNVERLEMARVGIEDVDLDYRRYVEERFDSVLGVDVLPWPAITQEQLVQRAIDRRPPFDANGGGYRDTLVWASVLELAESGRDVSLVSYDKKAFWDGDRGRLDPRLAAEVAELAGTVELIPDFGPWLLQQLPWPATDLASAVSRSRDDRFYDFYVQSDIQDAYEPEVEDLGFTRHPWTCEITEVAWDGGFESVRSSDAGSDGLALVEYDIGQTVTFHATFADEVERRPGWTVEGPDYLHRFEVDGEVEMILRLAVLFGDEFGFSVDEVEWRLRDGTGPGLPTRRPDDPAQLTLAEEQR